ncbi:MAG: amidohydrolase [Candidatus Thorarchaeota archaeon]|nr:amidohydrolase [Candidatus Thorarchaeota archaeon]
MQRLDTRLKYHEPILDAHTHGITDDGLDLLVDVQRKFGIHQAVLICHSLDIKNYAERTYPGRFIFAKYFSGSFRFTEGVRPMLKEIATLKAEGYHCAKMQSAPVMRGRSSASPDTLRMDSDEMACFFDALGEEDIPFILHLSDPDTYYASRYTDQRYYSTKEQDLSELEGVLRKYPNIKFQIAHFAAQPEIHRLDNLARWFDTYSNFNVDTSSARWLSRELSKDPKKARNFFVKYSNRMHFGTDCVAFTPERDYYEGRHLALRLLFETDIRNEPLPFTDTDTVNSGGTYINGLNLPKSVLDNIYWKNSHTFFSDFFP